MHENIEEWSNEDAGVWGSETYRMLKCAGCDTIYFQKVSQDTDDFDEDGPAQREAYWPAPSKRKEPTWMFDLMLEDIKLHSLLEETYRSLNVDARVLSAIGLRTIFDRASEQLGVATEKSFKAKLDELLAKGKIGKEEREILDVLTDAGGAAAHRGWSPSPQNLNTLMDIGENFIYRTFILSHEAKKLRKSVPARGKKAP